MRDVWPVLAIFALLIAIPYALHRLSVVSRRRGARADDVMGVFDDLWNPQALRPRQEVHAQSRRKVGTPEAGDPPWLGEVSERINRS